MTIMLTIVFVTNEIKVKYAGIKVYIELEETSKSISSHVTKIFYDSLGFTAKDSISRYVDCKADNAINSSSSVSFLRYKTLKCMCIYESFI